MHSSRSQSLSAKNNVGREEGDPQDGHEGQEDHEGLQGQARPAQ